MEPDEPMMKRYQVIRENVGMGNQVALNVHASRLGYGVMVVDTFKDNKVIFLTDGQYKKAVERGEAE